MLPGEPRKKYQYSINNLKVYRLSKLVLALTMEENRINPGYKYDLVKFNLDAVANTIITKSIYDIREEIACNYHLGDLASLKMHTCAQSQSMHDCRTA